MRIAPMISLGLSILVGIAAVVFGRGWLNNEAVATDAPVSIVQDVRTQKLLVASIAIERGDALSHEAFETVDWPVDHVPPGAVSDIGTILDEEGSFPYALGVMVPGEPLLTAKLSHSAIRDTLAAVIEPGFRAIAVEVSDASGVAGFVLPDHRVDVNVYNTKRGRLDTSSRAPRAETLLQDIRVLAVDQSFQENLEGAAPARTVTLQVTPAQARALGLASETSTIGLVLRPKGEEPLSEPVPVRRRAVRRAPAQPVQKFTNIRVIQGEDEDTVSAPVAAEGANQEVKN